MRILFLVFCALFVCTSEVLEFSVYKMQNLKDNERYLLSEKFDGVRGVWDGKTLKTKRGNKIFAPDCFTQNLPKFSLDGELWIDYAAFEKMQSLAAKKGATCAEYSDVKYLIFDAPDSENCPNCSLSQRLQKARDFVQKSGVKNIKVIEQKVLENLSAKELDEEVQKELDLVVKRGGEGLILRQDCENYQSMRSKKSFKIKPFLDAECKIVGYTKGKGKFENQVGAILCEMLETPLDSQNAKFSESANKKENLREVSESKTPKIFKIGSGLNSEFRKNPPPLNTIITYKYNGLSKNATPKHATFLRVRSLD